MTVLLNQQLIMHHLAVQEMELICQVMAFNKKSLHHTHTQTDCFAFKERNIHNGGENYYYSKCYQISFLFFFFFLVF